MVDKEHAQRMLDHLEGRSEYMESQRTKNLALSNIVAGLSAGKVFHTKAHKRQKNEKYYTPPWVTRCLWRRLYLARVAGVWEPAAGDGKISRELRRLFDVRGGWDIPVLPSDIAPEAAGIIPLNFLTTATAPPGYDTIITNPPFGPGGRLAFQFAHHALRLMQPRKGVVAMLLRDDFDSAGGRSELFEKCPAFACKIVINDRIRWTNLPQDPKAGPSGSHAWFVWDWTREPGPATLVYERADVDLKDKGNWFK